MNPFERKREQRARFLLRLYEVTGGNRFAAGGVDDLAKDTGLSEEETDTVVQYLEGQGLIEWRAMGLLSVTHNGVQEAERLLASSQEAATVSSPAREEQRPAMRPDDRYFSEREVGERPRDVEEISPEFWGGFIALVHRLTTDGSLAERFPEPCFETPFPTDVSRRTLDLAFRAEVPGVDWPPDPDTVPSLMAAMDGIEFLWRHVSRVTERSYHDYGRHHHFLAFDERAAREEYREQINRLFRRCGHPYHLGTSGHIERIGPPALREVLGTAEFRSGDPELNTLLQSARTKFLSPDWHVRSEALEKLWDAWERFKTLRSQDKKTGVQLLLQEAIPEPTLRSRVEEEAMALTKIGNDFMIRHTETTKTKITRSADVDYLFHRLFSLIWLLLSPTRQVRGRIES